MIRATSIATFFALTGVFIKVAAQGQTSLFIPGFDPQPISADVVGVDGEGRTTWALQAGQATDAAELGIPPSMTITLVEGPSNAAYTAVFTGDDGTPRTGSYDCTYVGEEAVCNAVVGGESGTITMTRDPFLVQVGTTAAAAVTTTPPTSAATTSGGSSVPSVTTGSGSPRESNGSNEQMKASVKVWVTMQMVVGLAIALIVA